MTDPASWDSFVEASDPGSYLQLASWAQVKAVNGWTVHRLARPGLIGAQILVRRPRPLPWGFAYSPRGPVAATWSVDEIGAFTTMVRERLAVDAGRVSHLRIDPEIEADAGPDADGAVRRALAAAGWRPAPSIQPASTRVIDLAPDEDVLFAALRKKWRQYVNKARNAGIVVVDAEGDRLPEFYRIYRETADRAGFLIRTEQAYRDVWEAYRPAGRARLLFAQSPDGVPLATLFLVRAGPRVVEPYGGMTHEGGESRANYLLKWEAIRSSREQGATSYDLWGLATGGIAHFKTGFGGREVRYIGAYDLTLDPLGRAVYEAAGKGRVWWSRRRHGLSGGARASSYQGAEAECPTGIRDATPAELLTWDRLTVDGPGGHVYQSRAWAAQRARLGWKPRFLMLDEEHAALVLLRPFAWIGGASAYVPRGPVAGPSEVGGLIAARTAALADWLADEGVDVVATDAEVPDAIGGVSDALGAAGFRRIPEIQPSRHRVSLALAADTDDAAVRGGITKSTRQRIDAAERSGVVIRRHDTAGWSGNHPLFDGPDRPLRDVLAAFATLLEGAGERLGFRFGPRQVFIDWWLAAHAAGHLVYLEARDDGRHLGGLILYRHGDRLSTVHSADAPGVRDTHPGVMHLLRWRAIQLAIREGRSEMDLGGVDVGPDHREPDKGDPMAGLYEHKRSFGAAWVSMIGAHERVIRPWRYTLGRLSGRAARLLRR